MRREILKSVIFTAFLAIAVSSFHVRASEPDKVPDIAGDSPQREKIISERREEMFKDVKAINVIICLNDLQGQGPEWFTHDALARDAIEYIHSGAHVITFVPGANREPQRQTCNVGPYLLDPGNLDFIVIGTVATVRRGPGEPFTFASISRTIYRPDHSGSVSGFLQTPFPIDLSGPKAHKAYDMFFKNNWAIGAGIEGDYAIPLEAK